MKKYYSYIALAFCFALVVCFPDIEQKAPYTNLERFGNVEIDHNERANVTYLNYYPVNVADTIHVQNDLNIYRSRGFRVFVFE